jgi:hypothetical protein
MKYSLVAASAALFMGLAVAADQNRPDNKKERAADVLYGDHEKPAPVKIPSKNKASQESSVEPAALDDSTAPPAGSIHAAEPRAAALRIKFASGAELEADVSILQTPGILQQILERAKEGSEELLAFTVGQDFPATIDLDEVAAMLQKVAPTAKLEHHRVLNILTITAGTPSDLRRAAILMRLLKKVARPPAQTQSGDIIKSDAVENNKTKDRDELNSRADVPGEPSL